ncbi:MAG: hypothetical protein BroJett012_08420 [Betaproteobacteria bacterium]|jgi:exodeoxyribonuclease VII small subunit|nr:MAG: hypothetical protein BroJett012_08420 [Betaproteobacteria bacterium]
MMAELNPESYNQAFAVLSRNAKRLQEAKEPDIDALVPLVKESMEAYQICKTRIDAVRAALAEQLGAEPAAGAGG